MHQIMRHIQKEWLLRVRGILDEFVGGVRQYLGDIVILRRIFETRDRERSEERRESASFISADIDVETLMIGSEGATAQMPFACARSPVPQRLQHFSDRRF